MRLPLHQTILLSAAASSVDGFSPLSSHGHPPASALRTYGDTSSGILDATTITTAARRRPTRLYYEQPSDSTPPGTETGSGEEVGIWTVLSNTEKWIAATLERSNRAAAPGRPAGQNPYSRKEVSYVCETVQDLPAVVASAFRRVKDSREMGEAHGSEQEHILAERGSGYNPKTFRQTNVVVLPSCQGLDDFHTFDAMVSAINTARRNARDYVTDVALEKLDDDMYGDDGERDWVVSISLAHLHPDFGKKTSAEILAEMKKEDEEGEVDVNAEKYREMRNRARQSPYPSLVMEVLASPPPDFGNNKASLTAEESKGNVNDISSADIKKLEQLFGQAATDHPVEEPKSANDLDAEEEAFWNSFGKLGGLEEISLVTPASVAKKWVAENDPSYDATKSVFVSGDLKMVDEAHEFVFSNIAMQRSNSKASTTTGCNVRELAPSKRSYLVLPNFLTSSATSFERFATEVSAIVDTIPGLSDEVSISTLHPETVETEWRSPHPILILQFYDDPESD